MANSFWFKYRGTNRPALLLIAGTVYSQGYFVTLFSNSVPWNIMLQDSEQGCPSRNVQLDKITFFSESLYFMKRDLRSDLWIQEQAGSCTSFTKGGTWVFTCQGMSNCITWYAGVCFLRDGLLCDKTERQPCQSFCWLVSDHIYESVTK